MPPACSAPAPKPWNIAWRVRVRYRAETSGLLGMAMPDMGGMGQQGGGEDQDERQEQRQQQQQQLFAQGHGRERLHRFIPC